MLAGCDVMYYCMLKIVASYDPLIHLRLRFENYDASMSLTCMLKTWKFWF